MDLHSIKTERGHFGTLTESKDLCCPTQLMSGWKSWVTVENGQAICSLHQGSPRFEKSLPESIKDSKNKYIFSNCLFKNVWNDLANKQ